MRAAPCPVPRGPASRRSQCSLSVGGCGPVSESSWPWSLHRLACSCPGISVAHITPFHIAPQCEDVFFPLLLL